MVRKATDRETTKRRVSEKWGRMAENIAAIMLCLRGYRILARRGRCLIFCEVKFRDDSDNSGVPSRQQQHRIMRAAEDFTRQRHISPNFEWRFDLIQIAPPFSAQPAHFHPSSQRLAGK